MHSVLRHINIQGSTAAQSLMRAAIVVFKLPQLQPVPSVLGIDKRFSVKKFVVVGSMTALNDTVLPGTAGTNSAVQQPQVRDYFFKGTFPLTMKAQLHCEFVGVVGPDEKKGGSISRARLSTPATVAEVRLS